MSIPECLLMNARYAVFGMMLALALPSFSSGTPAKEGGWREVLRQRLPLYGHRNWIVIADSAYPAQSGVAIETIVANADQLSVLQEVLRQLSGSRHVRPIVHTDTELNYLSDHDVPGIASFSQSLSKLLSNQKPMSLPHEQIISKLDDAAKLFRVLIIKTNSTMPYTTVFVQLDCAYWGQQQEKRLRMNMATHTP